MKAAANSPLACITLEDLPLAAFLCDPHGVIIRSNEASVALLKSMGLKKPFTLNMLEQPAHSDIARARSKQASTQAVVKLLREDGECWWFTPHTQGMLVIITPSLKQQEDPKNFNLSAHMAAALAHEIRNPLLSIKGAATLLEEALKASADQNLATLIHREASRVEALMLHLDPLSPSPRGSWTRTNIHEIIQHAVAVMKNIAPALQVSTHYDPSIPEITADASRLTQVLLNVLHNAVDAMENIDRCQIDISTRFAAQALPICIRITDYGTGIAPDHVSTLFMPFVSGKTGGKGLGLSIAHAIMQQHGGTIAYAPAATGGAQFTLCLPLGKLK